ncbi:uncharacterized protein LOC144169185 isoform X1 [Haemaphysalis longicornis]
MAAAHIDNRDTNMQRRYRIRYSVADDVALLQEVVNLNPFADQHLWAEVTENLVALTGKPFNQRSVKERVDLVLTRFLNEERACIRRSGTEEDYSAMDQLLQQVADLCKEFGHKLRRVALRQSRGRTENSRRVGATARCTARDPATDGRVLVALDGHAEWLAAGLSPSRDEVQPMPRQRTVVLCRATATDITCTLRGMVFMRRRTCCELDKRV